MQMTPPVLPINYAPPVSHDDLVRALRLIQHATAPTHDDGAYHEAAHDLASDVLKLVDAREAYERARPVAQDADPNRERREWYQARRQRPNSWPDA